jgi:hypothetical protein
VIAFLRIVLQLLADLVCLAGLSFRPRRSLEAENLFLRRQLALYRERGVKPRRVDAAMRVSLALLSRLFAWRDALVVVRPETLIRWHRAGWRLLWRFKSCPGRPPIPLELRQPIRRMAMEDVSWGEERIANELWLKLGLHVLARTVGKCMPKRPAGKRRGHPRWATFFEKPRQGDHCMRLLRHGHPDLPASLCACGPPPSGVSPPAARDAGICTSSASTASIAALAGDGIDVVNTPCNARVSAR